MKALVQCGSEFTQMKKKTEIKSNIIGNYFGFSYKSSLKKINTTYEKSLIIEIEDSYVVMEEH